MRLHTLSPPAPAGLDREAEAFHSALSDLLRVYQYRDRDKICCHDISVTQCHALELLVEGGSLRLGELAARLFLDKSTTSRVIDALVRKAYVEKQADPADGRASVLVATAPGRELFERINLYLVAQQKELLRDLDPEVRAGVTKVLRQLARAAEARFCCGVSVAADFSGSCCPK
jgi:DNA-binding MarR family transcriptional regulator